MPGKNGKKLVRVYLGTGVERVAAVSYTHLDVYKRQVRMSA